MRTRDKFVITCVLYCVLALMATALALMVLS
jgi:hypothetical protein